MADYAPLPILTPDYVFESRDDGTAVITPGYVLPPLWRSIPHLFIDRAERYPDRPVIARRELRAEGGRGEWRRLSFGEALGRARGIAQAFLDFGLGPDASVMVLSGADAPHFTVQLAAQMARAPYAPVSINYSLAGGDFARLRHCAAICRPRLVYADDWQTYLPAMQSLAAEHDLVLVTDEPAPGGETIALAELAATTPGEAVDRSIDAIAPDTHAKTIFTSGSTGKPKGVIQTQRILTGVVAQHEAMYEHRGELEPKAFLSWMPWSHVGGNNTLLADVINEAGCLYIDDGRPIPGMFAESVRNLREINLTEYNSTPIFFSELVGTMEADAALRDHFFARLEFLSYGAAGLSEDVFRRLQALSVAATGKQIPVITKYGATETQGTTIVTRPLERTGPIGLPFAGNVVKLAPVADRLEIRVKGLTVAPGYLNDPVATEAAFDEEGFYCTGDAARWVDPAHPELGLEFDGRVTENFKLQSGTWVHVGNLRLALLDALAPLLQDIVIAGEGRSGARALGWLRLADARRMAGNELGVEALVNHPAIAAHLSGRLAAHNAKAGGQSRRIEALRLLVAPPTGDEIADKGYINQRAVQRERASDVEALYRGEAIRPLATGATDDP